MIVIDRRDVYGGYVAMNLKDYEKLVDKAEGALYAEPDDYYDDDDDEEDKLWDEPWEGDVEDYDDDEEDMESDYDDYLKRHENIPILDMDEYDDAEIRAEDIPFGDEEPYDYGEDYVPKFSEEDIDFGPPLDEYVAKDSENFAHIGDIMEEVDRNAQYGKIEQKSTRERWSIPSEIKEGIEGESVASEETAEDSDEDRYYFENI